MISTTPGSSSQRAMSGPSAVRSMRAPRACASLRIATIAATDGPPVEGRTSAASDGDEQEGPQRRSCKQVPIVVGLWRAIACRRRRRRSALGGTWPWRRRDLFADFARDRTTARHPAPERLDEAFEAFAAFGLRRRLRAVGIRSACSSARKRTNKASISTEMPRSRSSRSVWRDMRSSLRDTAASSRSDPSGDRNDAIAASATSDSDFLRRAAKLSSSAMIAGSR